MRRLVAFFLVIPLLGAIVAPAAAEAPTMTEELLSGMVTEEVEPGVYRVINDGVRDFPLRRGRGSQPTVIAGHDGTVWLKTEREFFRLGGEATYPLDEDVGPDPRGYNPVDVVVTPDGTLWNRNSFGKGLFAFDGHEWRVTKPDKWFHALTMGSDGRVWAVWKGPRAERGRVGRFDGEWEVVTDAPGGYPEHFRGGMTVTNDGDIWLWPVETYMWSSERKPVVYRHDGKTWQTLDLPGGNTGHVAVGQDGTVWWAAMRDEGFGVTALHHFDGDGWQQFAATDEWPEFIHLPDKRLDVAPDGRLWVFADSELSCAARFNGDEWTSYVEGCLSEDLAPDGSAWVLALSGLYVITPEAVAATG